MTFDVPYKYTELQQMIVSDQAGCNSVKTERAFAVVIDTMRNTLVLVAGLLLTVGSLDARTLRKKHLVGKCNSGSAKV
jgi:hypothetical protein